MKTTIKLLITTLLFILIIPSASADVISNPEYPYNASDIVTMFDNNYQDKYDIINDDLDINTASAKEMWSENSMVGRFHITFADGIENGYAFDFIDKENPEYIYSTSPTLDDQKPWFQREEENTDNLISPLSNIHLVLRKLIPAMQKDTRLLPALDRSIGEEDNTSLFIDLKEDENGDSTWYMDFQVSGEKNKLYKVWVNATDSAKPLFKVIRKK